MEEVDELLSLLGIPSSPPRTSFLGWGLGSHRKVGEEMVDTESRVDNSQKSETMEGSLLC